MESNKQPNYDNWHKCVKCNALFYTEHPVSVDFMVNYNGEKIFPVCNFCQTYDKKW